MVAPSAGMAVIRRGRSADNKMGTQVQYIYPLIRVRVSRFFGPDDLVKVFTDGSKQYDWGDLALT